MATIVTVVAMGYVAWALLLFLLQRQMLFPGQHREDLGEGGAAYGYQTIPLGRVAGEAWFLAAASEAPAPVVVFLALPSIALHAPETAIAEATPRPTPTSLPPRGQFSRAHRGQFWIAPKAVTEMLQEAAWQRCYVHFLRNALDHVPRKVDPDCLTELRWLYDRREISEARRDLSAWLLKWQSRYPKLCAWVEESIEETWTFYRLPHQHHKHMRSTNLLERVNEEIKRRTHIVRTFPNEAACLRLVRALAVETHEGWQESSRYLNMSLLLEQRKDDLRTPSAA